ncbi:MAG TPA: hypothetical protein VK465_09485, partial [Fibrobacteria bacterium]|nr:hypothetical protein [Fibrobacteria bacterium]
MKLSAFLIAVGLTACHSEKGKERDMSSILKAEYWSTTADESHPLELTLNPAGSAKLWIRSNRD